MKHRICLTRVLTQYLTVEIEMDDQAPTDGQIGAAAIEESKGYFDTDWATRNVQYSWDVK